MTAWLRSCRLKTAANVADLRIFLSLCWGYWRSERWVEAWVLTSAVLLITTLLSKASVWAATASADFLSAIARFHAPPERGQAGEILLMATLAFVAIHLGRSAGGAARHLASATLHRRARAWLAGRFNAALLADEKIAFDLMSDRGDSDGDTPRLPDAIDQRVDECTEGLYGGVIGLAMGLWGAVASIYFIAVALLERSAPAPLLDRWAAALQEQGTAAFGPAVGARLDLAPGEYGTAVLVIAVVLIYVPVWTWAAWRIGRVLERQVLERQRRDGAWRGEMGAMLGRVSQLAASRGQDAQARLNAGLYAGLDRAWGRQNLAQSGLMMFTTFYVFLSNRVVAWAPALPAYMAGSMSFRDYAASSELAGELINDISWFIHVMPAIATLRANAGRLTDLAEAIERVRDRDAFYAETGIARIRRDRPAGQRALVLQDLRLRHRGFAAAPFLRAAQITLHPGDRAVIRGRNGCGKSSLLKAIAGLWPHGEGLIAAPDAPGFFAGQEPDLPERLSLKALACYPAGPEAFDDATVAAALGRAGLAHFAPALTQPLLGGKAWREVFSGGQKQRLVLARILLHRPALLLLDEATAALDTAATADFHEALREALPDAIVLGVYHGPSPPNGVDGAPFYTSSISIEQGAALLAPLAVAHRRAVAAE